MNLVLAVQVVLLPVALLILLCTYRYYHHHNAAGTGKAVGAGKITDVQAQSPIVKVQGAKW